MTLLERYIAGWRTHDTTAILATLDPECVVVESFGPIYRGHALVRLWIEKWQAEDGRVLVNLANLEWDEMYITELVRRGFAGDTSHPQGAYRLAGFDPEER